MFHLPTGTDGAVYISAVQCMRAKFPHTLGEATQENKDRHGGSLMCAAWPPCLADSPPRDTAKPLPW